jgi:hypothetical protein
MARALNIVLALATAATVSTGTVILPAQKAEASPECIYRYGHKYCQSDYWRGDCFWWNYDLYCRYYPKKKKKLYYYNQGGGY